MKRDTDLGRLAYAYRGQIIPERNLIWRGCRLNALFGDQP